MRRHDTGQPHLIQSRQGRQRGTHRLRDQLHPTEPTNRRQHMSRARPLPSPSPHQPRLRQPIHHHRQQPISPVALGKTIPELAEHRMIEPRLGQLHPQRVLPVDPARHRPRGLPIREVLRVLQHRHHRQPGRPDPTTAIHWKPARELIIDEPIVQPVPHHHRRRAFRARRPRHPRRLHRNNRTRTTTHRHPPTQHRDAHHPGSDPHKTIKQPRSPTHQFRDQQDRPRRQVLAWVWLGLFGLARHHGWGESGLARHHAMGEFGLARTCCPRGRLCRSGVDPVERHWLLAGRTDIA